MLISRRGADRRCGWRLRSILAFLYVPLIVILVLLVQLVTALHWPPPGFTTKWWTLAFHESGARDALVTSIKVGARRHGARPRARQPGLARGAALPVLRARHGVACWSSCRSRCPASSPVSRSTPASSRPASSSALHAHRGPRHVLHRGGVQQRGGPAATAGAHRRRGVGRPRRQPLPDLPLRDLPAGPLGAAGRRAARLRAVVRRDRRDHVHGRTGHPDAAACGSSTTCSGRTSCRSSTSSPSWWSPSRSSPSTSRNA